jgi:hypothetical protein
VFPCSVSRYNSRKVPTLNQKLALLCLEADDPDAIYRSAEPLAGAGAEAGARASTGAEAGAGTWVQRQVHSYSSLRVELWGAIQPLYSWRARGRGRDRNGVEFPRGAFYFLVPVPLEVRVYTDIRFLVGAAMLC